MKVFCIFFDSSKIKTENLVTISCNQDRSTKFTNRSASFIYEQLVKNWRIFIKNMQFHKQLIVMSKLCQFYTMSSGNILSILKPIFVYLSMIFLGHLDQTNCGSIWSHVRYTWQYKLTLDCLLFHCIGAVFV